ncbi:MAG: glycosyltransferase, partial [Chloroflexota bacterium]|nr:glycosyltransferase [Chloroflexota bacterium]
MPMGYDILCFSHLRWDWVYQRPQHLLSRLARRGHRVFFVEEPLPVEPPDGTVPSHWPDLDAEPRWETSQVAPNVIRCLPWFRAAWPFFLDEAGPNTTAMRRLLRLLIEEQELARPVAWFYAPPALPLLRTPGLRPRAIVYDCMDELALFKEAPPEMLAREEELLRLADVVFTGGRSMYEARRGRHPNLHLFPSSVDAAHFARALAPETVVPDDARPDPAAPTLGFYGVIDERLDLEMIDAVAARRPDWQFVFVGPTAKIDADLLPRRPNLSYPGLRPYEALPGYLKGWDVCLMPFARNEATRYISPTKTLEYLAADKPVVSTSVRDVVTGYRGVVRIADDPDGFVAAIDAALGESPEERRWRVAAGRAILARTSWDATAARMGA